MLLGSIVTASLYLWIDSLNINVDQVSRTLLELKLAKSKYMFNFIIIPSKKSLKPKKNPKNTHTQKNRETESLRICMIVLCQKGQNMHTKD